MSMVRIPNGGGLSPRPAARRPGDRGVVELEGLDGAISLTRLLEALHRSSHRLPVHVAVYITHEVARALRHLHDTVRRSGGRVHGAVNGDNVLLLRSGRVKLIARGPLLAHGDRNADLFMLGLTAWEMLVGWPPPDAGDASSGRPAPVPPSALRPGLPNAVDAMVLRALERSPRRRYPGAGALASDTARFLATRPDPRRGLRLLLNQVLEAPAPPDESGLTRRTRVPWRDGSGALPALPPPPPPSGRTPARPSEPSLDATSALPPRGLLERRPWLGKVGVFLFQTAVAAILASAALLAIQALRRPQPALPPPNHGTVIVPMSERAPGPPAPPRPDQRR
jgi:serine/threonine protein kinase